MVGNGYAGLAFRTTGKGSGNGYAGLALRTKGSAHILRTRAQRQILTEVKTFSFYHNTVLT